MSGISTPEAISYGINHMLYLLGVYMLGFFAVFFGFIIAVESPILGFIIMMSGVVLVFGGLHGAIYKMSGDATAHVLFQARVDGERITIGRHQSTGTQTRVVSTSPSDTDRSTRTTSSKQSETEDRITIECGNCSRRFQGPAEVCPICGEPTDIE